MAKTNRYTVAQVEQALTEARGMVFLAAKRLGCSPTTLKRYCTLYPRLEAVKVQARGVMVDEAELRLLHAIRRDEAWAIAFCLKTVGKDRGYTERHEQVGADGQPVVLKVVYDQSPALDLPLPHPARNGRL